MATKTAVAASFLLALSTSAAAETAQPDVALAVLDFDGVTSSYDQAVLRETLTKGFGARLLPVAVAEPLPPKLAKSQTDRDRIERGKRLLARLLAEATIWKGTPPGAKEEHWAFQLALFDVSGAQMLGFDELDCAGCSLDDFKVKVSGAIAHALARDHRRVSTALTIRAKPDVTADLSIDKRPFGFLPFTETMFVGEHEISIHAKGYQPATLTVTLKPDHPEELTVNLTPAPDITQAPVDINPPHPHRSPALKIVGGVLVGLGAAGIVAGGVSLSYNNKGTCSLEGGAQLCPQSYDTGTSGGALVGVGAAALVAGVITLVIDFTRRPSVHAQAPAAPVANATH